jgi:predicted TIM-barrel fold metal-dependent hydrolase
MVGTDRVLFGSDWPHPEGLKDPISFVDELTDFSDEDVAKIMGGNMRRLLEATVN